MLQNEKGKPFLQCSYLSLTCEQGILQNHQPSGWVGTQLWSYVHQHCVDIREGNIKEPRMSTSKKTGKVRCQLRAIWCHGIFGLARVNQHPPVHHAGWMDGWMDDGWIDVWMMKTIFFGGCIHVSYPTTVVNYVLNIHSHAWTYLVTSKTYLPT